MTPDTHKRTHTRTVLGTYEYTHAIMCNAIELTLIKMILYRYRFPASPAASHINIPHYSSPTSHWSNPGLLQAGIQEPNHLGLQKTGVQTAASEALVKHQPSAKVSCITQPGNQGAGDWITFSVKSYQWQQIGPCE